MTEDERAVLEMHAARARIAHLGLSEMAQVNYELQKKGLLEEQGCCGGQGLTEAGREALWEAYRSDQER